MTEEYLDKNIDLQDTEGNAKDDAVINEMDDVEDIVMETTEELKPSRESGIDKEIFVLEGDMVDEPDLNINAVGQSKPQPAVDWEKLSVARIVL